jgi:hypothetical protein
MAKFIVTYRLRDNRTYEERYEALLAQINEAGTGFWEAGTSLVAMETKLGIAELGAKLKKAVDPAVDLIFIREIDVKNTGYVGDPGDGFAYFFPEAKKL